MTLCRPSPGAEHLSGLQRPAETDTERSGGQPFFGGNGAAESSIPDTKPSNAAAQQPPTQQQQQQQPSTRGRVQKPSGRKPDPKPVFRVEPCSSSSPCHLHITSQALQLRVAFLRLPAWLRCSPCGRAATSAETCSGLQKPAQDDTSRTAGQPFFGGNGAADAPVPPTQPSKAAAEQPLTQQQQAPARGRVQRASGKRPDPKPVFKVRHPRPGWLCMGCPILFCTRGSASCQQGSCVL